MSTDPLSAMLNDPPDDADYDTVLASITASERGRRFLGEFASRNRHADTQMLVAAIGRVEAAIRGEPPAQSVTGSGVDLSGIVGAIDQVISLIAAATARGPDIAGAVERIADIAFILHERDVEASLCDALDAAVREIIATRAHDDAAAGRSNEAAALLRELSHRIEEMIARPVAERRVETSIAAAEAPASIETEPERESADEPVGQKPADPGMPPPAAALEVDLQDDEDFAAAVAELAASLPLLAEPSEPIADQPEPAAVAAACAGDGEQAEAPSAATEHTSTAESEVEPMHGQSTPALLPEIKSTQDALLRGESLSAMSPKDEYSPQNSAVDQPPCGELTSDDATLSATAVTSDVPRAVDFGTEPATAIATPAVDTCSEFDTEVTAPAVDASAEFDTEVAPPAVDTCSEFDTEVAPPAVDASAEFNTEVAAPAVDDTNAELGSAEVSEPIDRGLQWHAELHDVAAGQIPPDPAEDRETRSSGDADEQVLLEAAVRSAGGEDEVSRLVETESSRALLPEPQASLGPEEDPGDLFEPIASLPLASPVVETMQPVATAAQPIDPGSNSGHPDTAAPALLPVSVPDGTPSAPAPSPQPRAAAALPRATASDPLAAIRALSDEEIIALFS